jgi:hypothetical protein
VLACLKIWRSRPMHCRPNSRYGFEPKMFKPFSYTFTLTRTGTHLPQVSNLTLPNLTFTLTRTGTHLPQCENVVVRELSLEQHQEPAETEEHVAGVVAVQVAGQFRLRGTQQAVQLRQLLLHARLVQVAELPTQTRV